MSQTKTFRLSVPTRHGSELMFLYLRLLYSRWPSSITVHWTICQPRRVGQFRRVCYIKPEVYLVNLLRRGKRLLLGKHGGQWLSSYSLIRMGRHVVFTVGLVNFNMVR